MFYFQAKKKKLYRAKPTVNPTDYKPMNSPKKNNNNRAMPQSLKSKLEITKGFIKKKGSH